MRNKIILLVLIIIFTMASCVPGTSTLMTTATTTTTPTPTITPTPAPQSLAEAPDLPTWVEEYVHAFGGMVTVNGAEMDADQLTTAIRQNPERFTQTKQVDGVKYSFFVVNDIPLGIRESQYITWQKVHLRDIVEIPGGIEYIGAEPRIEDNFFDELNEASSTVETSWAEIEPQRGQYNFTNFDIEIRMLKDHGVLIREQALLCPSSPTTLPDWLLNGDFSKSELEQILIDHITEVVKHGKELGVTEWDVVNEPYIPKDRENDIFYKTFGGYSYIDVAFTAARKADPEAKLIYNDIDNHTANGYLTPLTRETINRLRTETVVGDDGVERTVIDAVGIEGHLGDWMPVPDFTDVEVTLKSYGLPVIITEFDYNLVGLQGSDQEKFEKQADVYAKFLQAAINAGVTEYSFWSFYDKDNFLTDQGITNGDPGLFDKQCKPKMDYYAVLKVLYENIP